MTKETNENSPLLCECFRKLILIKEKAGKERTANNYQSAWNKVEAYLGHRADTFTLAEFNTNFVQQYALWLKQSEKTGYQLATSTQDFYLRNLKAMYNKLKKELRIKLPESNPFADLQIKVPPTRKRALPDRAIRRLSELDLSDDPELFSALHLALFLFYARGMCFIDVFKLQRANVKDDYIYYERSKTGVALQVKITPEMSTIMSYYRRKGNPWLFPFLHEKLQGGGEIPHQSSLRRINRYLKIIGEVQGFRIPFTTYVMRHSWASMMLESDSEIGVISQSLGHMSLHTTEIYLDRLSVSKMDKASDDMLDHLIRHPRSKKRGTPQKKTPPPPPPSGIKWRSLLNSIMAKVQLLLP